MSADEEIANAAGLFKVLGHETRLRLVCLLGEAPHSVGDLVEQTGLAQPLVSQHLRTLRQSNLVVAHRAGKEVTYRLADDHVSHVVEDALIHVRESPQEETS